MSNPSNEGLPIPVDTEGHFPDDTEGHVASAEPRAAGDFPQGDDTEGHLAMLKVGEAPEADDTEGPMSQF